MGQRRRPKPGLELRPREANRLPSPRLGILASPFLRVEQGKKPEAYDVAFGIVRRVGSLDRLERDASGLVEIASEEQRLRQAREHAGAEDVGARGGCRDRTTSMPDGRAHIAALDQHGARHLDDRLDVRRPKLWSLLACTLGDPKQALNFDLGAPEQRCCNRACRRQGRVLHEQLGGKPPHPGQELGYSPAPDELAVVLDEQLGHGLGVSCGGGVLDRVLDEPLGAAPSRRAEVQLTRVVAPELQLQKLAE